LYQTFFFHSALKLLHQPSPNLSPKKINLCKYAETQSKIAAIMAELGFDSAVIGEGKTLLLVA